MSETKTEKKTKKEEKVKKPGVIKSILEIISTAKKPITPSQILDKLEKRFPDRHRDSMLKTVRAQIGGKSQPTRLETEKNVHFKIGFDEKAKEKNYCLA